MKLLIETKSGIIQRITVAIETEADQAAITAEPLLVIYADEDSIEEGVPDEMITQAAYEARLASIIKRIKKQKGE